MTLSNQRVENKSYSEQPNLGKIGVLSWIKKHALLLIGVGCLALWLASLNGKVAWISSVSPWLSLMGGLALVGEQLVKLV